MDAERWKHYANQVVAVTLLLDAVATVAIAMWLLGEHPLDALVLMNAVALVFATITHRDRFESLTGNLPRTAEQWREAFRRAGEYVRDREWESAGGERDRVYEDVTGERFNEGEQ